MVAEQATVLVLIPAYNEEATIGATINAVGKLSVVNRILVVDDGSTDRTEEVAQNSGAEVLKQLVNLGKGEALNRGLKEFREDILVLLDADLGSSASEVSKLIQPLLAGQTDMTIAKFAKTSNKGGFGLVKGLARWGIRLLGGIKLEYPLSGQRALSRTVVASVGSFAAGYGVEVALTIKLARLGYRIMEVDTQLVHQGATGRDLNGFLHRGRQFVHVLRELFRTFKTINMAGR